jgi:hypothetical protein
VEVAGILMTINLMTNEASESTLDVMAKQGFVVDKSVDISAPKLPNDITELDDEDLIRLFQHINEFTKFVKVQVAAAQIDESNSKKILEMREAEVTVAHTQAKVTVASIKAKVASDPDISLLTNKHQAAYNYRKMMEMMMSNLEADMSLVSRELTRRTSGVSFKNRAGKFVV